MSSDDATTAGFATRLKESCQSAMSTRRPWSELVDPSALSLPSSVSDATTRLFQNLTHFRFNYALLVLLVLFLGLIPHPFSIILLLVLLVAWFFLFFSRDEPLSVAGLVVDDAVVLVALGLATLVALGMSGAWWNAVISVVVGVAIVCLHAVVRSTDDLVMDDRQSPYGPLMSDNHDPQGNYTII